jgi:ParB/RepB/Spo0J family partition protein
VSDATLQQIPVGNIVPSPHNPRRFRQSDSELASLADSIRAKGVLQPILVRPLPDPLKIDTAPRFELIAGERRWRASMAADRDAIPAIVRLGLTDQEALELTVLENLQREDLSPLEEASGVASLLAGGKPLAEIADQLGKPARWVQRRARLAGLSPRWKALAGDPKSPVSGWPALLLEVVARVEPSSQDELLKGNNWWIGSARYVQDVDCRVADLLHELKRAPWSLEDATLVPLAGACTACPKRSSCNPGLFDEELGPKEKKATPGDRCLDAVCWNSKRDQFVEIKAKALEASHDGRVVFSRGSDSYSGTAPAFTKGKKVVSHYEGQKATATTKNAVPVLIIDGAEAGKAEYRLFSTDGSRGRGMAPAKPNKPSQPKVESLEEKREGLRVRRYARATETFMKALEKQKEPATLVLLRLLAVFGLDYNQQDLVEPDWYGNSLVNEKSKSKRSVDEALELATAKTASEALWKGVRRVIKDCATGYRVGPSATEESWRVVMAIGKVLGMDAPAHFQAAIRELPEPKGWEAEAAKGAKSLRDDTSLTKALRKPSKAKPPAKKKAKR